MTKTTRISCLLFCLCLIYNSTSHAQGICNLAPRFDQEMFSLVNKSTDVVYGEYRLPGVKHDPKNGCLPA